LISRRLLVVDPDRSAHEIIRGVLEREDRFIEEAYGRSDAEACLRGASFDVVLAGQGSNGSDGLRMARRVHALQPDARVILTGDSSPDHVIGAIRARVSRTATKKGDRRWTRQSRNGSGSTRLITARFSSA